MLQEIIRWLSHHPAESAIIVLIIAVITAIGTAAGDYISGLGAKQAEIKATQNAESTGTALASTVTPLPTNTSTPGPTDTLTSIPTVTPSSASTATSTPTSTASLTPLLTNTPTPLPPPAATNTPPPIMQSSIFVDARMNIFGAGKLTPPSPGDGGEGLPPEGVSFSAQPGQTLIILNVEGQVSGYREGCEFNGADGGPFCTGITNISSYGGISGIVHNTKTMFLVGVFLDNTEPTDPAPERRGYTDEEDDKMEFSPLLNQVFFIGDGRTQDGTIQQFKVPPNATRLYLGFAESHEFGYPNNPGLPGYYDDNAGGLTVLLEIR